MRTVYFEKHVPKFLITRALRPIWCDVVFSPLSPTRMAEIPDPPLPGPRWVRVRNRLSGICGSDLHFLLVETDPQVAPAALPGTGRVYLGHELVGEVTEVGPHVSSLQVGDRVILDHFDPNCINQGIDPPCRHCRAGNVFLCENMALDGNTQRVGGGWSDALIAHESSLYRVPEGLDDEAAMMIEPFSVGLRAALRRPPRPGEQALVVGCGTIGLTVIEALHALAPDSHITAMARYPQQVAMARRLGVDELVTDEDPYQAAARISGARRYEGLLQNRMLLGGFDVVYDCVGTARTVQDSLRWARAGETVVMAGISAKRLHVDLTPIWYQEVDLVGLYAHGVEELYGQRQPTYDLVSEWMLHGKLTAEGFITHRFPLSRWREAARTAMDKQSGAIKVVIDGQAET